MPSALIRSVSEALDACREQGVSLFNPSQALPNTPDLFSNDYLSLSRNPHLRQKFLEELNRSELIFGSTGTRALNGSTSHCVELESYCRTIFNAPCAMILNGGYAANLTFFGTVPQRGDVFLYDSRIHASIHDGINMSRNVKTRISFKHNSLDDFEAALQRILAEHPRIASGKSTLFIAVESVYSIDGDFCPLRELVELVEKHVPAEAAHIVVDEAHSIGLYGPSGLGLVKLWGLEKRVHTVIYPLTKALNIIGAVLITSPEIYHYIANHGRPVIFSTFLPHMDLLAIKCCFEIVMGPIGEELRSKIHRQTAFFIRELKAALGDIPPNTLSMYNRQKYSTPETGTNHLRGAGYAAQAASFPVVPRGGEGIRVVVHAHNTEEEILGFIGVLRDWATRQTKWTERASKL